MSTNGTPLTPPPFLIRRLRDLPAQPLSDGEGAVRDIFTDAPTHGDLRWMLQLVEIRGAGAKLHTPNDTEQLIVGFSGPQVTVGAERGHPLRRNRPLTRSASVLEFRRPMLRVSGASRLLNLAYRAGVVAPTYTFEDLDGPVTLSADVRVLVVLKGEVTIAGETAGARTAVVLHRPETQEAHAVDARVLCLRVADEEAPAA